MALKTDYKDDVLDGLRKYRMVNNSDGTVSFVDVTMYYQEGDDYGANDINATNSAINLMDNIVDCTTARNVAAKVVTLSGFVLEKNARITVRFKNTGTTNPSSGNLTLNVNNTGAKNIIDGHTNNTTMTYSNAGYFYNNMVCEFIYNGTAWVWLNRDSNTTYTGGTLKTAAAKTGSGSTVTDTIAANTTIDNAIGTLLNNDHAINSDLTNLVATTTTIDYVTVAHGNYTVLDSYKPSNANYNWILISVLPSVKTTQITGIEGGVSINRIMAINSTGEGVQIMLTMSWLGIHK